MGMDGKGDGKGKLCIPRIKPEEGTKGGLIKLTTLNQRPKLQSGRVCKSVSERERDLEKV